jgi:hypothetical protein
MQTLGVVAAAVLVAKLIPVEARANKYTLSCLVVTAVLSLVLFFSEVDRGVRNMREQRSTLGETVQPYCNGAPCRPYLKLTATEATNQVGARLGVNDAFVQWVTDLLGSRDTYYLVMTTAPEAGAFPQWITYRLLPNLATGIEGQLGDGTIRPASLADAKSADSIVFYGVNPRKWTGARLLRDRRLRTFAPGFSVARREP